MSAQGAYSATDTFYLATCTVLYTHQSWRQAQLSHCEHAIFRVTNVTLTSHLKVHSHQCNSNWNELVPNLLRIQFGPSPLSIMNADHHGRWTQIFSSKASKLETSWYVENRNFYLPYLHLAPQLEVIPFEFCQDLLYQKTRSPGLLYGTVSVILHLAIFMQ